MEDRVDTTNRDALLVGIAGMSLLCGMHFSPYFDAAFILVRFFAPAFFVGSPIMLFYLTSLMVALAALVVSGLPAALFERFSGRVQSDGISLGIWLAGAVLLALPVLWPGGR